MSCPNWSRNVKSGALLPSARPVIAASVRSSWRTSSHPPTTARHQPGTGRRGARGRGSLALVQLPLEDLAGGVARQLVEEDDLPRDLVAGEVLLHPALEVLLGDLPRGDHERLEPLAVVGVVDADCGDLDDGLVAGQAVLDLLGEDVL